MTEAQPAPAERPSLWALARVFGTIALTSFGGGQKGQIRRQLVIEKRWISDKDFIEGLEIAQVLPGPNVLNLEVYMGQRIRGTAGAIVALLAGSIPPFLIVLLAGAFYFSKWNTPIVHAALTGAAAAAVGLTLGNALELTAQVGRRWYNLIFVVVTAVAVSYFKLSLVLSLVVIGGISMIVFYMSGQREKVHVH